MPTKAKPKSKGIKPQKPVKYEGYIPGAHPTAPGGMSRPDLRVEAAEHHGIPMDVSRDMTWPALIDAVCQGRLDREREAKAAANGGPEKKGKKSKKSKKHKKGKKGKKGPIDFTVIEVPSEQPTEGSNDMRPVDLSPEVAAAIEAGDAAMAEEVDAYAKAKKDDLREQALRGMNVPALKAVAKAHGMKGYSTLRRPDLIDAILAFEAKQPEPESDEAMAAKYGPVPEDYLGDGSESSGGDDLFDPETLFAEMAAAFEAEQKANPPIFLGIPGIKDYVFDGHAGAGPSASERWMTCTMSLTASRAFLETMTPAQQEKFSGANLAARQGTTAHAVGEVKANHMLGRITDEERDAALEHLATHPDEGEEYNDEMDEYVQEYVDLIQTYANERGAEAIGIERRVSAAIPLTDLHEGEVYMVHGSADATVDPTKEHPVLVAIDLKFGDGIYVDATGNTQAMIYALAVLGELVDEEGNLIIDIERVVIHIAQPRLGGIKTWEITLDELLDWRDDVLAPALTKALYGENEGATFNPSETACQFCPARGSCAALAEQRYTEAAEAFTVIQDYEVEHGAGETLEAGTLTNERLGSLMAQIAPLVGLYKDLREEGQRRLHRGVAVPGYDLRNYSPSRKWKVEDEAVLRKRLTKALKKVENVSVEDLFKPAEIVTPTAAEKIVGPEIYSLIAPLIEKPDKRPVISTGPKDRRSKWEGRAPEEMFEALDDDESGAKDPKEMFPDD